MKLKGKKLLKRLKICQALGKSFREFLGKSAIHSYRYLVEPQRHISERTMWIILHILMTVASIYIVLFAWSRFTNNPTITTLESQHHSIFQIDFPAVAICNNNKISKTYAMDYIKSMMASRYLPTSYRSEYRLKALIPYLGRLYDSDIEGIEDFGNFQDILDVVDANGTDKTYDSKEVLGKLAPNCADYVVKCKWGGNVVNCSDIIIMRRTSEGFCCAFNYVKPTTKSANPIKALKPAGIGPDMGLTVLLNLSTADYYYPLKNYVGVTTLIFDPNEFADSSTGGVRVISVEPYQEVRVTVNVNTKVAVEEVQRYSVFKRGCMFPNDLLDEYKGNYIYGDCLVKCKVRSVVALCKCMMYNIPTEFIDVGSDDWPFCNLSHIQCLNKYRIKWATYRPREAIPGLEREIEDSLSCESCYPLCSTTTYITDSTASQLNFYYENKGSVIAEMNESKDLSVLKVYFPQVDSVLYTTNVLYAWYDIVSEYGGILSLCLGCSIISFFELGYFMTVRFYQNLFNSVSFMNQFKHKPKTNIFGPGKNLYKQKFDYVH